MLSNHYGRIIVKKYGLLLLFAFAVFAFTPSPALAKFNAGISFTDSDADGNNFSADDNKYKIYAGWTLGNLKWLTIEAQYVDFGEFDDNNNVAEANSFDVFGVAGAELWRFILFAKAGIAFWDYEVKQGTFSSDDGSSLAYGVGAEFRILPMLWIRAEWEVYDLDNVDVDVASLGVDFRF